MTAVNLAFAILLISGWVYLIASAVVVLRFSRRALSLSSQRISPPPPFRKEREGPSPHGSARSAARGQAPGWEGGVGGGRRSAIHRLTPTLSVPEGGEGDWARGARQAGVSVLKPLHGDEPGLYENLRSFAEQDFPAVQLVLGVNDPQDGALPAGHALIHALPARDIALVVDRRTRGSNRKVANLENMFEAARHDIFVLADSDMRVDRSYLAAVTAPLRDPRIGVVTCLYKGVATGGKWSALGAMHINFGFLPGALVAESLGIGGGCFGATIAIRRETLGRIGGFTRLRHELADDHRIGDEVRALGLRVELSPYIVEARVTEPSFAALWQHEVRWARTERAMAPVGFAGSILAQPVAIAALGAAAAGFGLTSCTLLVISCVLRWATARVIADALGLATPKPWLLPVRDALSFAVFVASFFARTVSWRDEVFQVDASGRMTADGDKTR
jgi:ceramide glucosyltransferase